MRTTFLDALEPFGKLLARRFETGVPTLEDGVRYTLFAALLRGGLEPDRIVLEYPHPVSGLIDTVLLAENGDPEVALEFKYDRTNEQETAKAGAALSDLSKLGRCPAWSGRFFIYVTGAGMTKYLAKPSNGLNQLLNDPRESLLNTGVIAGLAPTLRGRAGDLASSALLLKTVHRTALPQDHVLRVIEVA